MLRQFCALLAVGLTVSFIAPAVSSAKDASELELKMERVIVFKDGYSLVIKRGTATTDKSGEVFTDDVPDAAVLGSFWAVPEEGRIVSMLAGWKSTKDSDAKQLPCTQTIEILLANKGSEGQDRTARQDNLQRHDPGRARRKDRSAGRRRHNWRRSVSCRPRRSRRPR